MNTTEYRPDIDGLRAIAVTLVLSFHAFPNVVTGGFIGVDVFFVISGFLITRIICSSDFSISRFYARRARRLFPALVLVTGFSLVAGWLYLTPAQFQALGREVLATAFFVPNLLFWHEAGYFDAAAATKPLLHLWSLGVEEQFYLAWPAILLVSARFRLRLILVLLSASAFSMLYFLYLCHLGAMSSAFYSPLARAWELSAGGLLTFGASKRYPLKMSDFGVIAGLIIIIVGAYYIEGQGWPSKMAVLVILGSMLVIHFGRTAALARRTLASAPLVFLGKISYPLYLWHWPILSFLYLRNGSALSSQQACLALLASFCLAILTYMVVEEPLKRRVPLQRLAAGSASILIVVGVSGLGVSLANGVPWRLPSALQDALAYEQYDFKSDAYNPGCWLGDGEPTSRLLPVCIQADHSDGIAIWGDSHAARLSPGLRAVFGADRISQLTRNGCAPVIGLGAPASAGCSDGNADILKLIKGLRLKTVILFGAWQNYPTHWGTDSSYGSKLLETIKQVKEAGISDILVIGPAPRFDPSLPSMLLRDWSTAHWTVVPARLKNDRRTTNIIEDNLALIANSERVRFFSLLNLFCNEDGCLTRIADSRSRLLTWDYGHLTTDGAIYAARAIPGLGRHRAVSKDE